MSEIVKIQEGYKFYSIPGTVGCLFNVCSPSGACYEVNTHEKTCTCPSFRDPRQPDKCKHIRAVETLFKHLT